MTTPARAARCGELLAQIANDEARRRVTAEQEREHALDVRTRQLRRAVVAGSASGCVPSP